VKTPGAHFRHVIFRRVGAVSRESSALKDLLAHLRRARRKFSHSLGHKRTLYLAADLVTLKGKLASCATRRSVPGMCRAQIGCAMNVPWCGWGEGWQALQMVDY
jgi:hypothetical protein